VLIHVAKMLYALGLRRFPPIDALLGIAAGRASMNDRALQYLLANISNHYVNFVPTAHAGVAFIPATTASGTHILAKPGEVGSWQGHTDSRHLSTQRRLFWAFQLFTRQWRCQKTRPSS
jgi:hypothetical protein